MCESQKWHETYAFNYSLSGTRVEQSYADHKLVRQAPPRSLKLSKHMEDIEDTKRKIVMRPR